MAKLTISDAARACRVARSTLQRAINAGRLSLDTEHRIDTAELIRAGYTLHAALQEPTQRMQPAALQDAAPRSTHTRQDAAGDVQTDAALMQHTIAALERENALLRSALDAASAREQEARANTQAAREERAILLQMLQDMQHRYDRLLEAPRSTPPPRLEPSSRPRPHTSAPTILDPRGDMRRRIVALLREHPEGLTPAEMRTLLGVDRSGSAHMTQALPQLPCCGSCGIIQHPLPEEIQLHPAISTALDQLQAIDVAFDRPVRPGERQGRFDGGIVPLEHVHEVP